MLIQSNAVHIPMKDKSVQLCAFSPPYWGLRKYSVLPMVWGGVNADCRHEWGGLTTPARKRTKPSKTVHKEGYKDAFRNSPDWVDHVADETPQQGQYCCHCNAWRGDLGLEPTPELYLAHMMMVMAEVERVLRDDGVCFVNLGDSYAGSMKGMSGDKYYGGPKQRTNVGSIALPVMKNINIKPKSLCLIPQKFAIKCQEMGWIIRSEIIWAKPNPMPESVKDRPTRSHEQVWMMTKGPRYYWDQDAVREGVSPNSHSKGPKPVTLDRFHEKSKKVDGTIAHKNWHEYCPDMVTSRNIRDVWSIATEPTPEAHFATWPTKLVERMIRAATKPGDIVLDPFAGTAKTVVEAERLNRIGIGLDLSWEYLADIAQPRLDKPIQKELAIL